MENRGKHGYKDKEKGNKKIKKIVSYICDWIGMEGRNDLGSPTW